uniref:Uncharacterized protein n=1 Tax=Tanacetum cinerariifolium TaxID=118510 RepID=A0A699GX57_TANCI|nr:hypothetical protein [Tanacetum cinerariifolium]
MDPNSSLEKICLREEVVVISSDEVEGSGDWNFSKFQDTANSGKKKETKAMVFLPNGNRIIKFCLEHKFKRGNKVVKKELIVALRGEIYFVKFIINPEEYDVEPGVIFGRSFLRMTKAITDFGVGTITIYPDIDSFLEDTEEEEKSNDNWDRLLDFNIDDVPLLGEEGLPPFVCRMGKSSRNKKWAVENLNFFYQDVGTSSSVGGHLTQEEVAKEAIAIRMSQKFALLKEERPIIETMAYQDKYKKILDEVWKDKVELDGKIVKEEEEAVKRIKGEALKEKDDPGAFIFPIIWRDIDSDDEEDYQIKRNKFGAPIYGPKPTPYLNCNDQYERSLAIQTVTNPFWKISIWKKVVSFIGSLPVPLKNVNWKPDYKTMGTHDDDGGSLRSKHSRQHETVEDVLLPQVHHEFLLWEGCNRDGSLCCDGEIDDMLRIRLRKAGSNEEIFTYVAWIRAFNINKPIYAKLCHEFYSTYEFDDVCADDALQTKKIIRFRLGGRAHNLTLLDFARRLGLYQAVELKKEGFNIYFKGGLRGDEHLNAQDYLLSISQEENLGLSRSHTSTIRNLILRVIYKMIIYSLYQMMTGYDKIQKNDLWLLSMFDARHQNGVLTEDVVRSLSTLIYYRDLDTITLRDLIDFDGKLISEDPQPGVPRVGIPRPPRASMQDLYDRMGWMEIHQEAIERIKKKKRRTHDDMM